MFVMTAKVDKKKIILALGAVAVLIVMLIMVFGGGEATPTAAMTPDTNDGRVKFLTDFGWEVAASPTESGQVKVPDTANEVFARYNALQKSQGYDLSQYAGKTVMRYVYKVQNYPNATDPVFATVLVYKDQVIGGDVTDTSAKGVVRGFKMPAATEPPAATLPTNPTQPTQ